MSDLDRLQRDVVSLIETGAAIKLHVGCGSRVLEGWLNVDLHYEHYLKHAVYMEGYGDKYYGEEVRGGRDDLYEIDVTETSLPIPDRSVDVIFHEGFIEHLSQRGQVLFLAETCRVLKEDGIHRINMPDLRASVGDHSDFTRGFEGIYVLGWDKSEHIDMLTPRMLEEMAHMVGYSGVTFTGKDQSASELVPPEYRPDLRFVPERAYVYADLTVGSLTTRLIEIPVFSDHRGSVAVLENLPFDIRRVFYIYDVPYESVRGGHALKTCHQILVAVSGSFNVTVDGETYYLTSPGQGLYIPSMTWRELTKFGSTSVCLVLASELYDEDDYIRDYDEFLRLKP